LPPILPQAFGPVGKVLSRMAVNKRRCASCRYFQTTQLAGNGWCTHPKRQLSSDVRILVRKDELACRNSWGNDLWASALSPADADVATEPSAPVSDGNLLPIQKLDDEITSVVASGTSMHASSLNAAMSAESDQGEDIVVGEASLVPERIEIAVPSVPRLDREDLDDGSNPGVHDEQAIRMEIMARGGNQDALQQARERLRKRRTVTLKLTSPVDILSVPDTSEEPPSEAANEEYVPDTGKPPVGRPSIDRRELNAHLAPAPRRDRRSGLPPRAYNDPMPPVPASESAARSALPKVRAEHDAFDSVPKLEPGFDLPLMDAATRQQLQAEQERLTHDAPGDGELFLPEEQLSSYDLVLQRARAIRASTSSGRANRPQNVPKTTRGPRRSLQQSQPAGSQPTPQLPPAPAPAPALMRHQPEPLGNSRTIRFDRFVEREEIRPPAEPADRRARHSSETPSRKGFDVNMLISRGISFRRQEVSASPESDLSSSVDADVDNYVAVETPIAPSRRHGPSFRRRMEAGGDQRVSADDPSEDDVSFASAGRGKGFDYDADEILLTDESAYQDIDENSHDLERDADQQGEAAEFEPGDGSSVIDDSWETLDTPATPGRQRDPYRPQIDPWQPDASLNSRDQQRGKQGNVSRGARTDSRIRTAEHLEQSPIQDFDRDDRRADLPELIREEVIAQNWQPAPQFENLRDESMDGWSFEPQLNLDLRDNRDMDAFRARLFNNPPFSSRPDVESAPSAPTRDGGTANDDRVQQVQPQSREFTSASPKDSLLRSSSFGRQSKERAGIHEDTLIHSYPQPMSERDVTFDLKDIPERQGDVLDMTLQLAPDLPRSCRTCRDFRPSETGDRGWCTNSWAFKHSQMVEADDLACQSTIGCWWLPYDEVWLPEARETSPTPRVAQMVTTDGKRKQSG